MQKYDIYVNIFLVIIMNMKEKKFLLIKDNSYKYINDFYIYNLINDGFLDNNIKKIGNRKELIIFKNSLDNFISFYYSYFSFLKKADFYLKILIKNILNIDYDYLYYKKICIGNFYSNIKYVYNYNKSFFVNIGITRKMSLKDKNDIEKIFDLMLNMIKANKDKVQLYYIFEKYDVILKEKNENNHFSFKNNKKTVYYSICDNWDYLITNYCNNLKN